MIFDQSPVSIQTKFKSKLLSNFYKMSGKIIESCFICSSHTPRSLCYNVQIGYSTFYCCTIKCNTVVNAFFYIHETEIKMVKSKWSYKKFMVEIRNRNELRGSGSKRITRVETDYEGRNELRGSKQITRVKTDYEGQNRLRESK